MNDLEQLRIPQLQEVPCIAKNNKRIQYFKMVFLIWHMRSFFANLVTFGLEYKYLLNLSIIRIPLLFMLLNFK